MPTCPHCGAPLPRGRAFWSGAALGALATTAGVFVLIASNVP